MKMPIRSLVASTTFAILFGCGTEQPSPAEPPRDVDWPVYLGDAGRQHYSPLTEITRENVAGLQEAWRYDSGPHRNSTMYTSPLVVGGVLYGLAPDLTAFALDAATGEELWRAQHEVNPGAQRGLMWWASGNDRRVFFTSGANLYALNANDGSLVATFGDGGVLDLTPDADRGYIGVTVPGVVFEDQLIMGFSTTEGEDAHKGAIRSFSAIDGSLNWQFDTIPKPGDIGSETWAEGSLERAGGANVWTGMALDEERGLLFAPTGSATPDFYGANRLGDNLFANSLVALDARTGAYRWHFQVIRHDLWDRDNPAPPTLVQLERDGETIDAVALTTKSGQLFVFDRETGESIYDIHEIDALPSTLPGEVPAATQPLSAVVFSRQSFEVTQRTPEATAFVEDQIKDWDLRHLAPPKVGTVAISPWFDGGSEWGGSAFDPANNRLILNANDVPAGLEVGEIPAGFSAFSTYAQHCGACHGLEAAGTDTGPSLIDIYDNKSYAEVVEVVENGAGRMPGFAHLTKVERGAIYNYLRDPDPSQSETSEEVMYVLTGGYVYLKDHENLPGNTPPWGTLNSIDMATGEIIWQVPFGDYPTHPGLGYGSVNYGGPVVTATGLIFIAATPDMKIRAFDSRDASILWESDLPAAGFSTPAVYSVDGRQFVVIAAGGGRKGPPFGSEYIAYALPTTDAGDE